MEFSEEVRRINNIFYPFAFDKVMRVANSDTKFVQYCSAEALFNIITSKKMRMRNAAVMNDFMEIEHGGQCLAQAWHSDEGRRFKTLINSIYPEVTEKIVHYINGWTPVFQKDTFISCLSEHYPECLARKELSDFSHL